MAHSVLEAQVARLNAGKPRIAKPEGDRGPEVAGKRETDGHELKPRTNTSPAQMLAARIPPRLLGTMDLELGVP